MRIPLSTSIRTRTGAPSSKDARLVNSYVEVKGEQSVVRKRPIAQGGVAVGSGTAQGGIGFNLGGTDYVYTFNGDTGALDTLATAGTNWSGATSYVVGDRVAVGFDDYWALADNTNSQPPSADWSSVYVPPIYVTTYATWDDANSNVGIVYSNGNLTFTDPSGLDFRAISTIGKSSGKWYWEVTQSSAAQNCYFGIGADNVTVDIVCGGVIDSWGFGNWDAGAPDGLRLWNAGTPQTYGADWGTEVIGILLNMDDGELSFTINGVSQGVAVTGLTGTFYAMASFDAGLVGNTITANFGASAFAYSVPSGYNSGLYT